MRRTHLNKFPHRPTIWADQTASHQPTMKMLSTNQNLAVALPVRIVLLECVVLIWRSELSSVGTWTSHILCPGQLLTLLLYPFALQAY